jgi:hypothetical protein
VRAGRGFRAEIDDIRELNKIDDLDPDDPAVVGLATPSELIQDLTTLATSAGVTIATYNEGRPSVLAATYAGYTPFYQGSGTHLYAVLSAAAHSKHWADHLANHNAILRKSGAEDQRVTIMDVSTTRWATEKTVEIVERAMRDAEAYAGNPAALGGNP